MFLASVISTFLAIMFSPLSLHMPTLRPIPSQSTAANNQSPVAAPAQGRLHLVARDKRKQFVTDLSADQLELWVDGAKRHIEGLEPMPMEPIYVAYLMDISGSRRDEDQNLETEGIMDFFQRVLARGGAAYAAAFSDQWIAGERTEGPSALDREIRRLLSLPPHGGTALYDAVIRACYQMPASESGRRAIVVVTDGKDNASRNVIEEAVDAAQKTHTTIHVLLYSGDSRTRSRLSQKRASAAMKRLTLSAGGSALSFENRRQFKEALQTVENELLEGYVLVYSPGVATDGKRIPKLKVKPLRKGIDVDVRLDLTLPKR